MPKLITDIIDRAEFDAGDRQERNAGVTGLVLLAGLLECGYVPPHMVRSVRRVLRERDEGRARYERAMRDPMLARAPV